MATTFTDKTMNAGIELLSRLRNSTLVKQLYLDAETQIETERAAACRELLALQRTEANAFAEANAEIQTALEVKAAATAALDLAQRHVIAAHARKATLQAPRATRRRMAEQVLGTTDPTELSEFLGTLDPVFQWIRSQAGTDNRTTAAALATFYRIRQAAQALQGAALSRAAIREELVTLSAQLHPLAVGGAGFRAPIAHSHPDVIERAEPRRGARASAS